MSRVCVVYANIDHGYLIAKNPNPNIFNETNVWLIVEPLCLAEKNIFYPAFIILKTV